MRDAFFLQLTTKLKNSEKKLELFEVSRFGNSRCFQKFLSNCVPLHWTLPKVFLPTEFERNWGDERQLYVEKLAYYIGMKSVCFWEKRQFVRFMNFPTWNQSDEKTKDVCVRWNHTSKTRLIQAMANKNQAVFFEKNDFCKKTDPVNFRFSRQFVFKLKQQSQTSNFSTKGIV